MIKATIYYQNGVITNLKNYDLQIKTYPNGDIGCFFCFENWGRMNQLLISDNREGRNLVSYLKVYCFLSKTDEENPVEYTQCQENQIDILDLTYEETNKKTFNANIYMQLYGLKKEK